jgi:hypothetical protein
MKIKRDTQLYGIQHDGTCYTGSVLLFCTIYECKKQSLHAKCHYVECRYAECLSALVNLGEKKFYRIDSLISFHNASLP